jgi:hypothetical protein
MAPVQTIETAQSNGCGAQGLIRDVQRDGQGI